jgi:transcriptional regulator with XRE-family HTH domain
MEQVRKVNPKQGTSLQLSKIFGVSKVTVSKALNGRNNSDLARRIRQAAIIKGGDPIY